MSKLNKLKLSDVTRETVNEAYVKTGLKPTQGVWTWRDEDGNECACALSAVIIANTDTTFEDLNSRLEDYSLDAFIEETFGESRDNLGCFTNGFDGEISYYEIREWTPEQIQLFNKGVEIGKEFFPDEDEKDQEDEEND